MIMGLVWPVAFVAVALAAIRAGVLVAEGRRRERMAAQDRNTAFLANERAADDKIKTLAAYAQMRAEPTSLERELADLIDAAASGHSPDCDYCSCGYAKDSKKLRELPLLLRNRAIDTERRIKTKLRCEGWTPPAALAEGGAD